MNVGQLRDILSYLDDDTPVVTNASDHMYELITAETVMLKDENDDQYSDPNFNDTVLIEVLVIGY